MTHGMASVMPAAHTNAAGRFASALLPYGMSLALGLCTVLGPASASAASSGTPYLVKDIWEGEKGSNLFQLVDLEGTLFFIADDGIHRSAGYWPGASRSLWRSDGTEAGTMLVKQLNVRWLKTAGRLLFLTTLDDELWVSDGRSEGTQRLGSFVGSVGSPALIGAVGDYLLFRANDGKGEGLWRSDGTVSGTQLLRRWGNTMAAGATDGRRYFFVLCNHGEYELWSTDGSNKGSFVATIPQPDSWGFRAIRGRLYFKAHDPIFGWEPWTSDGTEAGTHLLKDVRLGLEGSDPQHFTDVDGTVFFVASGTTPKEIWKTDGTQAGTVKVRATVSVYVPLPPGLILGPSELTAAGGRLFFRLVDDLFSQGVFGDELGVSDGTSEGTGLLKDIWPGPSGSGPHALAEAHGILYFAASDGIWGCELWHSDGTEAGTELLADVRPGSSSSSPYSIVSSGSRLFFSAYRSETGRELWAIDLDTP